MNYYNEWDSFAAKWLKELIKDGLIPDGEVDSRSIADVEPSDLKGFTQCHFFAGIGGWSRALQLAGWSSDRPVWTGSPPCQPFSTAGKQSGKEDLRHLWPVFFNLIRECQPSTIFGEQVASAIRFGWLDDLQRDLEAEGYAAAAVVLPSGCVSAPHKRDRLFFVAHSNNERYEWSSRDGWEEERRTEHSSSVSMANANGSGLEGPGEMGRPFCAEAGKNKEVNRAINDGRISSRISSCQEKSLGNSNNSRSETFNANRVGNDNRPCSNSEQSSSSSEQNFWSESEVIYCRDGKYRPIPTQPALFPLANGLPNRVGILRGAGNAIVPQAAAEIIKAYMSCYR